MCGICGFTKRGASKNDTSLINQMLSTIEHRGPENTGSFHDPLLSLGHVRLSIIDLSEEANQPFTLANRYVISYNGETYNYKLLRQELLQLGYSFETSSDTEVVLTGYVHFGTAFFKKMNGMFALAIYDREKAKLTLARDRFGIKPLYYSIHNNQLVFGSEIKAIISLTRANVANTDALSEFLYFGNALGTKSLYRGVNQISPGSYLEYDLSKFSFERHTYWKVEDVPASSQKDLRSIKNQLLGSLEQSVERHLISDVPVGLFLSGGIDSSLIAHFASKNSSKQLTAYTASFEYDKGVNEVAIAQRLSRDLNIAHEEIRIKTNELPQLIEKLVHHHDGPFSDAANIPLYLMSEKVRNKHKVILQGDGGDEFFGGYRRYKLLSQYQSTLKRSALKMAVPILSLHSVYKERVKRISDIFDLNDSGERMARLLTSERPSYPPESILSPRFASLSRQQDPFHVYRMMSDRFKDRDEVQKMLFTDSQIILPNIFLEKVDRSTMANSVEVRIPFLDNEITELALSLSSSTKLLHGKQKGLLLDTIKPILPDYILNRKKTGFSVPFENWLKGPLKEMFFDYLNSDTIANLGLYNRNEIEKCYKLHCEGKSDKGFLLWKVLNLNVWLNNNELGFE